MRCATRVGLILGLGSLLGCAGRTTISREQGLEAWRSLCLVPHATEQVVSGSVYLRARSFEDSTQSGQFSADVRASRADGLRLQILNPLGGREAEIRVTPEAVWINGKRSLGEKTSASWGGIPLRYALELFLGIPPCPKLAESAEISVEDTDTLVARSGSETYRYRVKRWVNGYYPSWVQWQPQTGAAIEFLFEDVDSAAHYAKKWEAKGASGEVKVKWRERRLQGSLSP